MNLIKKRFVAMVGLLALVGLIVAACGGADPTAVPQATTAPAAPAATPVPAKPAAPKATAAAAKPAPKKPEAPKPEATRRPVPTATPTPVPATPTPVGEMPKRGGTIRFYSPIGPTTLDPTKIESFTIWFELDEAWSNLIQYKSDYYTQIEFIPDLADKWEVNKSGDAYTFHLNKNARFQNLDPVNGRKLNAHDVKWSFDLFLDKDYGSQIKNRIQGIKSLDVIDDYTIKINLKAAANNFLFDVAWVSTKTHARELVTAKKAPGGTGTKDLLGTIEGLVGSGPFVFDQYQSGSLVRMVRSNNYWRDGVDGSPLPYLDAYEVVIIPDSATHVAAIRAGQIDLAGITGLNKTVGGPLIGVKGIEAKPVHPGFIHVITMNNEKKPFNDKRVRQAVLKATDARGIMTNATKAPEMPLESFTYSTAGDLAYPAAKLAKVHTRDVEGAKALLAAAGYPNGIDITYPIWSASTNDHTIQHAQQLEAAGFKIKLTSDGLRTNNARRGQGKYEIMYTSLNLQLDPVAQIQTQWTTGAARNWTRGGNPQVDKLIMQAKGEFDRVKLKQLMDQCNDLLWDDVLGIPMSPGQNYQFTWEYVKGFRNQAPWGNQGLKFAWLDK